LRTTERSAIEVAEENTAKIRDAQNVNLLKMKKNELKPKVLKCLGKKSSQS